MNFKKKILFYIGFFGLPGMLGAVAGSLITYTSLKGHYVQENSKNFEIWKTQVPPLIAQINSRNEIIKQQIIDIDRLQKEIRELKSRVKDR